MVRHTLTTAALAATALFGTTFAQGVKGTREKKCPAEAPCGGLYGDCGVGAFCLGGCDPTISHSFDSCVPNPVCKSGTYKMNSLGDVQSNDKYLGDNSKINWVSQGQPTLYKEGMLLTMAEGTVGTLLASSFYVWYGKICAKMSTSFGKGVVTAFIMMSDVKDEIDFEWVGLDVRDVQSNWYSQGVTDYTNGKNITVDGKETNAEIHEYCIDWSPDQLTWSVNGNTARTVKKSDTKNDTANKYDYPQTPSRIMLSLWPAGLPTNGKGTIDWAGGEIDWNDKSKMTNGYYAAQVNEVTVECYDPPAGTKKNGDKSYKYTDKAVTQESVEMSDDLTVLGSLDGTGEKPGESSKSSDGPAPTKKPASVPGGVQGGGARQETTTAASSQPTGGSDNSGGSSSPGSGSTGPDGFDQGIGPSAGVALEPGLTKLGGSALAIVVAILGLVVL